MGPLPHPSMLKWMFDFWKIVDWWFGINFKLVESYLFTYYALHPIPGSKPPKLKPKISILGHFFLLVPSIAHLFIICWGLGARCFFDDLWGPAWWSWLGVCVENALPSAIFSSWFLPLLGFGISFPINWCYYLCLAVNVEKLSEKDIVEFIWNLFVEHSGNSIILEYQILNLFGRT